MIALINPRSLCAGTLHVAIGSSPNNLDPYYATDANSQDINRLLHLSLVDSTRSMKTQCRACVNFEESRLPNAQHKITFTLKDNLRFHDGTKVTAINIKESVQHLLNQEGAPIPGLFKELTGCTILSENQVELVYKNYRPENLTNLSLLKIEKFTADKKKIPAGPFKLVSKNENEVVVENEKNKIVFKVVGDETTMALKLINGEIDLIATTISPRKTSWLAEQENISVFEKEGTNYVYISPQHRHPDLQNVLVRKALSHAIPRSDLAKYKQKSTVALAQGMFSSAFNGLYIDQQKAVDFDPVKSRGLLQQAGYKFKNGGWHKDGRTLSLTLKISNKKHIIELAKALVPYFANIGVPLQVQAAEWGTFYRDLKAGNFDLALGQWIGFVGPDQMGFTFLKESFPPNGANRGYYFDEIFEKYYTLALNEQNLLKSELYYRQANQRLIDDEAYISLWHPKIMWIANNCVKSLELYPTGNFLAFETLEHQCLKKNTTP
tara:strand:+ start:11557 stop:13035 length:1479 start_codon:yes stop_codon:yes gene_type:complete